MKKNLALSFENTRNGFAYKSDKELKKAYRIFSFMKYPWLVKIGSFLGAIAIKMRLPIQWIIRNTIFEQFCGGETLKEVAQTAFHLHKYGVACVLDYGVEASDGEDNYNQAVKEIQNEISYAGTHPGIPMISLKITGFIRTKLLEKYHKNKEKLNKKEKEEWDKGCQRIDTICQDAYRHKISVLIDAEETWIQQAVDDIALQMMEKYNKERATIYNTYQLYLKDRIEVIKAHRNIAKEGKYLSGIKIVRGAYMDKERDRAEEKGVPSPIQPDKKATDEDYNKAIIWCLEHLDFVALFIGTHNEESCMLAAKHLHQMQLPHNHSHVHFSQLFGMSDNITFNLAKSGYNVSKYIPYGPIKDVFPYLIRRSKENSSISGQMGRELRYLKEEVNRRK